MKVTHSLNLKEIQREVDSPTFLLGDNNGSFTFLSNKPFSRYGGYHIRTEQGVFKILEDVALDGPEETEEIVNNVTSVQRLKGHNQETLYMPKGMGTLMCFLEKEADLNIVMDVKKPYDNREKGRHYHIAVHDDHITITFEKRTSREEDDSDGRLEYKMHIVLYADHFDSQVTDKWVEREYHHDKERNSTPWKRWVYEALRLRTSKVAIAAAPGEREALTKARQAYTTFKTRNDLSSMRESSLVLEQDELMLAYDHCKNSLSCLKDGSDIYAGLPWFFQHWARDSAITAKGLWLSGQEEFSKKMLFELSSRASYNGRIPNRIPATVTESADATGWTFHRLNELDLEKKLTLREEKSFFDRLIHVIYLLRKFETKDGLDVCGPQESWMDSIQRQGALIELQAMRATMYSALAHFSKTKGQYLSEQTDLLKEVRKAFWNKGRIRDAAETEEIRPNIFMAYYLYPRLFPQNQWEQAFDHSLHHLWLSWGGFSTLDVDSETFHPDTTGEDAASYHNGDSWYFINNMAALAMHRLNPKKYKEQVEKIVEASTREVLWMGCVGHHAEISSASGQKSQGSPVQAWSAALFIELMHELHKK
ncbi:MAG: amylo-alpha-1,6-glucosidase [archaeon]